MGSGIQSYWEAARVNMLRLLIKLTVILAVYVALLATF